jgi:hypothetical protein
MFCLLRGIDVVVYENEFFLGIDLRLVVVLLLVLFGSNELMLNIFLDSVCCCVNKSLLIGVLLCSFDLIGNDLVCWEFKFKC